MTLMAWILSCFCWLLVFRLYVSVSGRSLICSLLHVWPHLTTRMENQMLRTDARHQSSTTVGLQIYCVVVRVLYVCEGLLPSKSPAPDEIIIRINDSNRKSSVSLLGQCFGQFTSSSIYTHTYTHILCTSQQWLRDRTLRIHDAPHSVDLQ